MDLRGLAALSGRILSLLADPETHWQNALELYGVSRIFDRRGETDRAMELYQRTISAGLPVETDRAAEMYLARLAKREGDFVLARELWEKMMGNSREGYVAFEELAVYYEHRARQPQNALVIVRKALDELCLANRRGTIGPSLYRERSKHNSRVVWSASSARVVRVWWMRQRRIPNHRCSNANKPANRNDSQRRFSGPRVTTGKERIDFVR
jgi:tetratricopeptide (TPR) repeat protein